MRAGGVEQGSDGGGRETGDGHGECEEIGVVSGYDGGPGIVPDDCAEPLVVEDWRPDPAWMCWCVRGPMSHLWQPLRSLWISLCHAFRVGMLRTAEIQGMVQPLTNPRPMAEVEGPWESAYE